MPTDPDGQHMGETTDIGSHDARMPGEPETGAKADGRIVLEGRGISLGFRGVRALTDVSFAVREGELLSIIGPNGAGKTSLLNCISGRYRPDRGELIYDSRPITRMPTSARARLGIARTFQNLALFAHMSVLDNIMIGRHHLLKAGVLRGGLYWFGGAQTEDLAHRCRVEEIIDLLEIEHIRHAVAGTLSYGLRKRVELARALAIEPKLLLLDEPMAGMNLEEREDIARYIIEVNAEWGVTVVMIEHDMGVVMDLSDRVIVLNYGEVIADGSPGAVAADPAVRAAYLGDVDAAT
jgi:branched-chain amino acid transport system ATP-binding protein